MNRGRGFHKTFATSRSLLGGAVIALIGILSVVSADAAEKADARLDDPPPKGRPLDARAWGCDDNDGCTLDQAVAVDGRRQCLHIPIPDCVACEVTMQCPPVDLVFVVDTSGSMGDEALLLCAELANVVADLAAAGVAVNPTLLGIDETPGGPFDCLDDDVVSLLGSDVPGDAASCPFPDGISSNESWGPATAIVAEAFPWTEGSFHLIVPLCDGGPCNGSFPDGCNDPGDDLDSITNAVNVANDNGVVVSPITGAGSTDCVTDLAALLASDTGGVVFHSQDAQNDLIDAVKDAVTQACMIDDSCDDALYCTVGERCIDNACTGGLPLECHSLDDQCNAGLCDEDADACATEPAHEGEPCDDDLYCTVGETCSAGACDGGTALDCSGLDNQCNLGVCDEDADACVREPTNLDQPCNDGMFCTVDEACTAGGSCGGGAPRDCTEQDDHCNVGVCDDAIDACLKKPAHVSETCDDGEICTLDDVCTDEGTCVGDSVMCVTDTDCRANDDIPCDASNGCETVCEDGFCVCGELRSLCLEAIPTETLPSEDCFEAGEEFLVNVQLGEGLSTINSGQFWIHYDPSILGFVSIDPAGLVINPETGELYDSPFNHQAFESVDEIGGLIVYVVHVNPYGTCSGSGLTCAEAKDCGVCSNSRESCTPDDPFACNPDGGGTCNISGETCDYVEGTKGPAPMATITFEALDTCREEGEDPVEPIDLCFGFGSPGTSLANTQGATVDFVPCCAENITVSNGPPSIDCPKDITCSADPGRLAALLTAEPPVAADGCGGETNIECTRTHSFNKNVDCEDDGDCAVDGQVCHERFCVDCVDNAGCAQNQACIDGVCVESCVEDKECDTDAGETCQCGVCRTDLITIDEVESDERGTLFPVGHSQFECTATDDCGQTASCCWSVDVRAEHTVEVNVQLSPNMDAGPLERCIEFEVYASCPEAHRLEKTLSFGLPFDLPGYALRTTFEIPAGQYGCATARDPLHTLRSATSLEIQGNKYVVSFLGDPLMGGSWLVGGDLNGDGIIDNTDMQVWQDEFDTVYDSNGDDVPDGDTSCEMAGTRGAFHADINGDGVVDAVDESFIILNFAAEDVQGCCPAYSP
ncbi:MAG: hypothetical protein JSU63_22070 [Phycisphaerales bacterium]|nr:MAG: hypothetical protein JSU63_22070 [Phycisphaerales bacterium]